MPEEQQPQEEAPEVTEQAEEQQSESPQEGDPGKTFDSDYVEKLRKEAAKYRTEAKQNAAAAKRLSDIEESQKSELQKWQERAESAEGTISALQAAQTIRDAKEEISQRFGVPANALRGSDVEELEEHAATLKALLPEPTKAGQVRSEGRTVSTGNNDPAQQFANIITSARRG